MTGTFLNEPSLELIDPFAHHLTHAESVGLAMLRDKHERYVAKGRTREAQGMKSAILIMWQALLMEPLIDTGWGEI